MSYIEEVVMYFFIGLAAIYLIRFLFFQSLFESWFRGGSMEETVGKARRSLKALDLF
jgi:hypothetical protein